MLLSEFVQKSDSLLLSVRQGKLFFGLYGVSAGENTIAIFNLIQCGPPFRAGFDLVKEDPQGIIAK